MVWADARFLCKEETSLDDNRAMRAESGVGTLLSELMALDFAIDELGLYLTTHPEDTEVLNLYWSYIKLGREGREAYEKQYGPILQTDVTPGSFKWLNDPWPWDLEGEK